MAEEAPMATWRRDWATDGFSSCLRLSTGVLQSRESGKGCGPLSHQPCGLWGPGWVRAWVGQARLPSCLELLVQGPTPPALAESHIN